MQLISPYGLRCLWRSDDPFTKVARQIACMSCIYITIHNSSEIRIRKYEVKLQLRSNKNVMVGSHLPALGRVRITDLGHFFSQITGLA